MLKLTVRKETTPLGTTGDMVTVIVAAGALDLLVAITEPDPPKPGTPPEGWRVYVGQQNCDAVGASLLHALELGVAAAARWIAVEMLKDPAPPGEGAGVSLSFWTMGLDATRKFIQLETQDGTERLPGSVAVTASWSSMPGYVVQVPDDWPLVLQRMFATEEQALAYAIEHAAPWIAAALVKEVES